MAGVEQALTQLGRSLVGGAGVVGMIFGAVQFFSIQEILLSGIGLGVIALFYALYHLQQKIENRLDRIEQQMDTGFAELHEEIKPGARTDGGESSWKEVRGVDINEEEISSVPSVAGAAAGGLFGAMLGPQGAVAGAALGALIGGGAGFKQLKDKEQEHLRNAALAAIQRESNVSPFKSSVNDIEVLENGESGYWTFQYDSQRGIIHYARISQENGKVEYRRERDGSMYTR